MAQTIDSVDYPHIEHGILIDLTLTNPDWNPDLPEGPGNIRKYTYYISNCYTPVVYNTKTYQALGGFLSITDIQGDLQFTNNEITLALSAIPSDYIEATLKQEIKGGSIKIYRVFFDTATQQIRNVGGTDEVFLRFNGVITNYAVQETVDPNVAEVSHTITVTASSILMVLENRYSGRRTNTKNYQVYYPEQNITNAILTDPSMDRIVALKAATFDFGKKQ